MGNYDVGIIGAGVAGSSLAILLAKAGKKVVLFEKEIYPSHKVCGEFVSMESYDFLKSLGLALDEWNLPQIKTLKLTSQKGENLEAPLKVGGFGISRFKLDHELALQMNLCGVQFYPNTKVLEVSNHTIRTKNGTYHAPIIIGAHGKYSPGYLGETKPVVKRNFIGVKQHIKGNFREDLVSLHSFDRGYCGMSKIEDDLYCLCYLIEAQQLKHHHNRISEMEEKVLWKNEALKTIWDKATFAWDKPLVISNIRFKKNQLFNDQMLFLGDAAGSISPLSGNGMSIAARSALLLSQLILEDLPFGQLTKKYNHDWDKQFGKRINKAELLNTILLNPTMHHVVLKILKGFKPLKNKIINDMQGEAF